jgi:hypothetical protein
MSPLSPRTAVTIAVAVVLPGTVLAISQFNLASVDMASSSHFQDYASGETARADPAAGTHTVAPQLEMPRGNSSTTKTDLRSSSPTKSNTRFAQTRRGPGILKPAAHPLPNSFVFAVSVDPFADGATRDQIRAAESTSTPAISQVSSLDEPKLVSSASTERDSVRASSRHASSTDSVVAIPGQPAHATCRIPMPCYEFKPCYEFNLFGNLTDRIFPQFP